MKILADISHPAHAWFFRHPLRLWAQRGHEIMVAARDKEMNLHLLDSFHLTYQVLSRKRGGIAGLLLEMIEHESRLLPIARRFRPDVMVQVGGTFVAHVGAMLRIPSVIFYDTDNATLQNAITYPFASAICTPDCYPHDWGRRHVRYAGYHELSYLHPAVFTPDPQVPASLGLHPGQPYYLLRFVSWQASHDVGESGFSASGKLRLVRELESRGRVLISSEAPLPSELEPYRIRVGVERVHDLMAFCRLYVGESATMASECAVLGVPALYISKTGRCYTTEQQTRYGLVYNFTHRQQDDVFRTMVSLLESPGLGQAWQEKRRRLLADKIDVSAWTADFVENFVKR